MMLTRSARPRSALAFKLKDLQVLCLVAVTIHTACTRPVLGLDLDRSAAAVTGVPAFLRTPRAPKSLITLLRLVLLSFA